MPNRTLNEGYHGYQLKLNAALGSLVSLYVDPEYPDDFIPGYVRAVNGRQVLLEAVTLYGRCDGFLAVRLSAILMILSEDDLARRLRRMLEIEADPPPAPIPTVGEADLVHALCLAAMGRGEVVTLILEDEDVAGFVTAVDDMRATVRALDYFGKPMEPMYVRLRDVEMASMGAEEERMLHKLYLADYAAGEGGEPS